MNNNWQAGHEPDELEALRVQVAELNKVIVHQDECYAGLEKQLAAMTQERDTLNAALDAKITICGDTSLAAAQARIVELREALDRLGHHEICHESCEVCKLLTTPDDSSALDELMEKAYSKGYDVGCADTTGDT